MQLRWRADQAANNSPATIIRNGHKLTVKAKDVNTGDFVMVEKNQKFPVDAILLSSSYEDGSCFIQTAELDG
jgi:P-type E1-E2 ATPase